MAYAIEKDHTNVIVMVDFVISALFCLTYNKKHLVLKTKFKISSHSFRAFKLQPLYLYGHLIMACAISKDRKIGCHVGLRHFRRKLRGSNPTRYKIKHSRLSQQFFNGCWLALVF